MFESVCTYPLPSDLFAQAIHPTEPLIVVGLASGQVQTLRLPSLALQHGSTSGSGSGSGSSSSGDSVASGKEPIISPSSGRGLIETVWQTKRHVGSCRSVAFSVDGERVVSAGSEGVVKIASTQTGRVERKIAVPTERNLPPSPSLLHVLSPETLLLATDTAALHLYDFRTGAGTLDSRPQQTHYPHDDYVSSLSPLPPTTASASGFSKQWVSTGGSTLAVTDLRRGVLVKSEDQEEELLSSVYVRGLGKRGTSQGEKVVVGGASGVIMLWEKGVWDDQDERIVVDAGRGGGESLDTMVLLPEGMGRGKGVVVGMGDGRIKVVRLGMNKVVAEFKHDDLEGVSGLGFEPEGRMISGGGQAVKVWQEIVDIDGNEEDGLGAKRGADSGTDDSDDGSGDSSSEEEEKGRKRRKKRKRNRGKDKTGGDKQILAFKGLD